MTPFTSFYSAAIFVTLTARIMCEAFVISFSPRSPSYPMERILYRLRKVSRLKVSLKTLLLAALCALGTVQFQSLAMRFFPLVRSEGLLCTLSVCLSVLLYIALLRLCGLRFGKKKTDAGT